MKTILLALGFMAVFEGMMPLIAPQAWLNALRAMSRFPLGTIRAVAFIVVALGLAFIWAIDWAL